MSSRFEAEEILRAAASGAVPSEGDVLLRTAEGWVFLPTTDIEIKVSLEDISEPLDDRFILPAAIAYEDEINLFTERNTFSGQLSAPDFEAGMRFSRR